MTFVRNGYVARRSVCKAKESNSRNWWLVKASGKSNTGWACLGTVNLPKQYVGKKIRFKVEVIED